MDGIAIIGIGCRFPGRARDPRAFWQLLAKGVNAVGEAPADRPGFRTSFDADPDRQLLREPALRHEQPDRRLRAAYRRHLRVLAGAAELAAGWARGDPRNEHAARARLRRLARVHTRP